MSLNVKPYIDKAIAEILNPQFKVTKQYLEVNEVEYENGLPRVERIDLNYTEGLVAVYFPFKNERYFLQVNLQKVPEIEVDFVYTENGNSTYLTATSYTLSFDELCEGFPFELLSGWSKGDRMKNGKAQYNFSRVSYEPFTSEAYDMEMQLALLLNELEKNAESVRLLSEKAEVYISVCKHQYISGNAGIVFDAEMIKRLANLSLSVAIDTYIVGTPIRDGDD